MRHSYGRLLWDTLARCSCYDTLAGKPTSERHQNALQGTIQRTTQVTTKYYKAQIDIRTTLERPEDVVGTTSEGHQNVSQHTMKYTAHRTTSERTTGYYNVLRTTSERPIRRTAWTLERHQNDVGVTSEWHQTVHKVLQRTTTHRTTSERIATYDNVLRRTE